MVSEARRWLWAIHTWNRVSCVPGLGGLGRVGEHTGTGPSFSDPQPSMEQNSGTGDTAPGAGLDRSG